MNFGFSFSDQSDIAMRLLKEVRQKKRSHVERRSPRVLVFACKWCGLMGADAAGKKRISLPSQFRVIPVECVARVEPDLIIKSMANGIDGVAVLGCHIGGCRYDNANHAALKRLDVLKTLFDTIGIGASRLLVSMGMAHEYHQFADVMNRFFNELAKEPPLDGWVTSRFSNLPASSISDTRMDEN